ncbi:hypothetical protein VTI28DRAFT_5778 [Corynascus sepedonium]
MSSEDNEIVIEAVPLTREAFVPFGDVIENPRPDLHPSRAPHDPSLHFSAVVANQGSAIKYQDVSRQINLYDQAPSGRPGYAIMSMFVCAARARIPDPPPPAPVVGSGPDHTPEHQPPSVFPVTVLERHPFTTQTFTPLAANPAAQYLVIVAPTLPSNNSRSGEEASGGDRLALLPVPANLPAFPSYPRPLPGCGMPDVRRLRAFVASANQAVTYGAGTWHAPMVALGERKGTALDFVVVQFANGVAIEDCQEVFLGDGFPGAGSAGTWHKEKVSIVLRPLQDTSKGKAPGGRAKF